MGKREKDLSGTYDEDFEKLKDVDIDDIPEEVLEDIVEKQSKFTGRIKYGEKSVFVKTFGGKFFQLIKTKEHFVFHYIGKGLYKKNCWSANRFIDISELDKCDFAIRRDNIKKIVADCQSLFYPHWGKLTFKLKSGKSKSFGMEESCGYYRYNEFFDNKFKTKHFYLLDFTSWSYAWKNRKK
ncbi:MAG: hypothetical protein J6A98_03035 [Clostridia bacterium]|nr:hypothetical protein [Clostridia bacterium]